MRDDIFTDSIRYDYLAISYGNHLCKKYLKPHLLAMIRSKLRLIGRFLVQMKTINNPITDFSDALRPKYYKDCVKAINLVSGLNERRYKYRSPAIAFALGTLLKKCAKFYEVMLIEEGNPSRKEEVIDFVKVLELDLPASINKTVEESQEQLKRRNKRILPKTDDIKKLNAYLNKNIDNI